MEKLLLIGAETCLFITSLMLGYWYLTHGDGVILFFSVVMFLFAVWCHKLQKQMSFKS